MCIYCTMMLFEKILQLCHFLVIGARLKGFSKSEWRYWSITSWQSRQDRVYRRHQVGSVDLHRNRVWTFAVLVAVFYIKYFSANKYIFCEHNLIRANKIFFLRTNFCLRTKIIRTSVLFPAYTHIIKENFKINSFLTIWVFDMYIYAR